LMHAGLWSHLSAESMQTSMLARQQARDSLLFLHKLVVDPHQNSQEKFR
jgi:hypothetical protein